MDILLKINFFSKDGKNGRTRSTQTRKSFDSKKKFFLFFYYTRMLVLEFNNFFFRFQTGI